MKKRSFKLSDAEMSVMLVLWESDEPMRPTAIADALDKSHGWSVSTVQTLLSRLNEKKAVKLTNIKRFRYYHPAVSKDEFAQRETKSLIETLCERSPVRLMAGLIQSTSWSEEELGEIEAMLREARRKSAGEK